MGQRIVTSEGIMFWGYFHSNGGFMLKRLHDEKAYFSAKKEAESGLGFVTKVLPPRRYPDRETAFTAAINDTWYEVKGKKIKLFKKNDRL